MPIWGSGRAAIDHFQNGNYCRGAGYTILAVSDVFLIKSLAVGAGKLAVAGFGKLAAEQATKEAAELAAKEASKTVINGFKSHAVDQAITRGFKTSDILKILREGTAVEAMGRYGPQTRYTLEGNTVIVNAKGEIVTVFSETMGTRNGLGKGFFIP